MGVIEKQSIRDIADAIRDRNGLTTLYKPRQMDEAIRGLYKTEAVNHVFDNLTVSTTKEGTSFTLDDAEGEAEITELKGNTTQEGTPTPTSPVEVKTVSGDNNIVVSNKNLAEIESNIQIPNNNVIYIKDFGKDVTFENLTLSFFFENAMCTNNNGALVNFQKADGTNQYRLPGAYNITKETLLNGKYSKTESNITFRRIRVILNGDGYNKFTQGTVNIQLEKGTQATSYIAHQGNSYRVDLRWKEFIK